MPQDFMRWFTTATLMGISSLCLVVPRPALGEFPLPASDAFEAFLQARSSEEAPAYKPPGCEEARSAPGQPHFRPTQYGHMFRKHRVFFADSRCVPLYRVHLPAGGWFGLIAFNGTDLTELTPESQRELTNVLQLEGPALFESNPRALALFFLDSLSWERHGIHPSLVESSQEVEGAEQCRPPFEGTCTIGDFKVDRDELAKYEASLRSPHLEGDAERGWIVEYVAIQVGTARHRGILKKWRIQVAPDFHVKYSSETLSTHVFNSVPQYMI